MSQPTRARTTGGARKPRNVPPDTASSPVAQAPSSPSVGASAGRPHDSVDVGALPAAPASNDPLFTPETLARTLRAVAAELERDPDLARRVAASITAPSADTTPAAGTPVPDAASALKHPDVPSASRLNRAFRPKLVTGASPDLGPGIPDPFALYQKLGADGLRAALDELRLGSLRAILREHRLDPKGALTRQNDAAKLRAVILAAATKGHK